VPATDNAEPTAPQTEGPGVSQNLPISGLDLQGNSPMNPSTVHAAIAYKRTFSEQLEQALFSMEAASA
jgi:hypothetical protein